MSIRGLMVIMGVALAAAAHAQFKAGEYVGDGGGGTLVLGVPKGGGQPFKLLNRGANFHVCELEGTIRGSEALMDDSADEKLKCIVTFKPGRNGIAVNSKNDGACSVYCGARARFEGDYQIPPAGCAPSEMTKTRARFQAAYDGKRYAEALSLLAPLPARCSGQTVAFDDGRIRNDLALTQHRFGDDKACRSTLASWLELAQTPDKAIEEGFPPADAQVMLDIAKATRYNLKLCGAPVTINPKLR